MDLFAANFTAAPSHNHRLWAKLLEAGELQFIATTNFDTCIEQVLAIPPLSDRVTRPYTMKPVLPVSPSIRGKLIKLHGYNLGQLYSATVHYKKALSIYSSRVKKDHTMQAVLCNNLGNVYLKRKLYKKELLQLERAVSIWKSSYGPKYFYLPRTYNSLGKVYQGLGDYQSALEFFNLAAGIAEKQKNRYGLLCDELIENQQAMISLLGN